MEILFEKADSLVSLCGFIRSDGFRRRPAMFVGSLSFLRFRSFVDGYLWGLHVHHASEPELDKLHAFFESVAVTYKRPAAAGWANIIWAEHFGDGPECFWTFFKLFDAYFEELKSDEYYVQLLELYRGHRKQSEFVAQ